jgi:hypothetical protein
MQTLRFLGGKCFSKNTNVTLTDGSHCPMHRLHIGDRVLVFDKDHITSSPILAVLTHFHTPIIDFIDLYTVDTTLRLTPTHFLLVRKQNERRKKYARALDVSVGDFLFSTSSLLNITSVRITRVERRTLENEDAYTPLTYEGTVIVNDLVASCYSTHSPAIMHVISKPVQWWFWILVKSEFYHTAEWSSRLLVHFLDLYNSIINLCWSQCLLFSHE